MFRNDEYFRYCVSLFILEVRYRNLKLRFITLLNFRLSNFNIDKIVHDNIFYALLGILDTFLCWLKTVIFCIKLFTIYDMIDFFDVVKRLRARVSTT